MIYKIQALKQSPIRTQADEIAISDLESHLQSDTKDKRTRQTLLTMLSSHHGDGKFICAAWIQHDIYSRFDIQQALEHIFSFLLLTRRLTFIPLPLKVRHYTPQCLGIFAGCGVMMLALSPKALHGLRQRNRLSRIPSSLIRPFPSTDFAMVLVRTVGVTARHMATLTAAFQFVSCIFFVSNTCVGTRGCQH